MEEEDSIMEEEDSIWRVKLELLSGLTPDEEELLVQHQVDGRNLNEILPVASSYAYFEALKSAARTGHLHMVKSIVQEIQHRQEAKKLVLDLWPWEGPKMTSSPVHVAAKEGHAETVHELLFFILLPEVQCVSTEAVPKRTCSWSIWFQGLLEWAVRCGHDGVVRLVLELNISSLLPAFENWRPTLPFHLAAHHKHTHVLTLLLDKFIPASDHDARSSDLLSKDGLTPLHVAAQSGCLSAVEPLLTCEKMRKDVNARSYPDFFTALHMAANSGQSEVIRLLLQTSDVYRLNFIARDCMGRTALHYAAREGHESVLQQLVQHAVEVGSNIASIADYDGLLPLHMAARAGRVGCIRILKTGYAGGIHKKAEDSVRMREMVEREYMYIRVGEEDARRKFRTRKDMDRELVYYDSYTEANSYYGEKYRFPRPRLVDSFYWRTANFTPLHFAVSYGHEEAVRELLGGTDDLHMEQAADAGFNRELARRRNFNRRSSKDLDEEKKALEELQEALTKGSPPPLRMHIVQRLENGMFGSVTRELPRLAVKMDSMDSIKRLLGVFLEFQAASVGEVSEEERTALSEAFKWALDTMGWLGPNVKAGTELMRHLSKILLQDDEADAGAFLIDLLSQALKNRAFEAAREIVLQLPDLVSPSFAVTIVARQIDKLLQSGDLPPTSNASKQYHDDLFLFFGAALKVEGMVTSSLLRRILQWAQKSGRKELEEIILERPDFKKGLYEDRQVYLDCANAILVGAVLIAGVAFQAWLQPPLGYGYTIQGEQYADVQHPMVRTFWRFNNGAFFLAVGALLAGAKGAVPVAREEDVLLSVAKVRRAVAVASLLLGMAVVCVVVAFAVAGFAVLPPSPSAAHTMMRSSVGWGGALCALSLLWFYSSVLPLAVGTRKLLALLMIIYFCLSFRIAAVMGDSTRKRADKCGAWMIENLAKREDLESVRWSWESVYDVTVILIKVEIKDIIPFSKLFTLKRVPLIEKALRNRNILYPSG